MCGGAKGERGLGMGFAQMVGFFIEYGMLELSRKVCMAEGITRQRQQVHQQVDWSGVGV